MWRRVWEADVESGFSRTDKHAAGSVDRAAALPPPFPLARFIVVSSRIGE
jgi:hypothetical protein